MKEITYFYLAHCPYCRAADQFIAELIEENPEFKDIPITRIEETQNPEIADSYDYYHVPCLYIGKDKLHEGAATKEKIRKVFEAAIER